MLLQAVIKIDSCSLLLPGLTQKVLNQLFYCGYKSIPLYSAVLLSVHDTLLPIKQLKIFNLIHRASGGIFHMGMHCV